MPTNDNINYGPAAVPPGKLTTGYAYTPPTPIGIPVTEQPVATPAVSTTTPIPITEQAVNTSASTSAVAAPGATNQQRYITVLANGVVITNNATSLNFTGNGVAVSNLGTTGANIVISGGSDYSNSNVSAFLAAFGSNVVSTTGNVTAGYVFGNGSQLTGLPATYGNANVVANLAALGTNPVSTTGNVTGGNVLTGAQVVASGVIQSGTGFSTGGYLSVDGDTDLHKTTVTGNLSATGNITANVGSFFIGNGSQLTGLAATYGNANVVANLAALGSNPVSTTGNVTSGNLLTSGLISATGTITGTSHLGNVVSVTANVTGGNVLTGGLISATGNITGGNVSTGVITLTNGAVIKDTAGESVAFGQGAGNTTQGQQAVAIGLQAGFASQGNYAVAIGKFSANSSQGEYAVAIGPNAGFENQLANAVAIGSTAGASSQGINSVAVGVGAAYNTQGNNAVAVGNSAGYLLQGLNSVSIGDNAGFAFQGANSVAVGRLAGNTSQCNNSIILNATGAVLDQTTANTFTVSPVRNDVANVAQVMFYNTTSKEITYGNTVNVAGNVTGGNVLTAGIVSATGNVTGNYFIGNGSQLTGIAASYGNANVATFLAGYGSNTISTSGNITAGNLIGNISITGNVTGTSANVTLVAGSYSTVFDNTGAATFPGNITTSGNISATGSILATPAWTSAGAITFTATTTSPTKGTTTSDNISYRQLGAKQWEIILTYIQTVANGVNGSGDYLVTLPNGLSFDTTLPSQQITTTNIGTNTYALMSYIIPSGSGLINNDTLGGQVYPIVYDATKFRILTTTYGSAIQCWGSGYYSLGGDDPKIQLTFRFTST